MAVFECDVAPYGWGLFVGDPNQGRISIGVPSSTAFQILVRNIAANERELADGR